MTNYERNVINAIKKGQNPDLSGLDFRLRRICLAILSGKQPDLSGLQPDIKKELMGNIYEGNRKQK